jgi:hypothetical protein
VINSRSKGARFERWVADWFKKCLGKSEARRGQQFSGSPDSPDVKGCITGCHIECKAKERINVNEAMDQAIKDKASWDVPVVIHKKNYKPVLLTIRLEDLVAFTCHVYTDMMTDAKASQGRPDGREVRQTNDNGVRG